MMRILLILLFTNSSYALTFNEAINALQEHKSVESLNGASLSSVSLGEAQGSWGDPTLKLSAMNFPKDSLKKDETSMTGIELAISQKISLTNKFGDIQSAFDKISKSYNYEAKDLRRRLTRSLWDILILKRNVNEEVEILKENLVWLSKILKVSKKLYVNGKISQQAILDIEIRKSEIEMELNGREFELQKIREGLIYLLGEREYSIDEKTIPWNILKQSSKEDNDFKQLSLVNKLEAKSYLLSAANKDYIPDITLGIGYTKRADIDGRGDFVGASVSFPLPFSSSKYSKKDFAVHEKYSAQRNLDNYKMVKLRDSSILKSEIKKIKKDLTILNTKTSKFAVNSRAITSKSYSLGNSSYVELLQSELKLQRILILKSSLEKKRDSLIVALKYTNGEALNE